MRVYERYDAGLDEFDTYACSFVIGKRWALVTCSGDPEDPGPCETIDDLYAKAPRVAFARRIDEKGVGPSWQACVLNLRTGARRCPSGDLVLEVGLTGAGSLAWLDSGPSVHKLEAGTRRPVTLDEGKDIDPTSFAVGGHYVYWTKADVPRSAAMP